MKISEVIQGAAKPGWHPLARPHRYGAWGASHGNSTAISGEAARMTGSPGYTYDQPNRIAHRLASAFLSAIHNSPGAPERLYHGFKNRTNRVYKPGEQIDLPLVAATGDIDTAASYATNNNPQDFPGVVFEFPAGTPMAGYSRWNKADAKDFGHVWSEALVGGRFRVVGLREQTQYGWHDRPVFTVVTLELVALFDPHARQWVGVNTG
jgi:hypothetical protein